MLKAFKPPWPNGQGVGLLIRRLWVRVPQGVQIYFGSEFKIFATRRIQAKLWLTTALLIPKN